MTKNKIEYQTHIYDDYNKKFDEIIESKIPFKIGIVVLVVTAFETVFKAFESDCWLQVNFISDTSGNRKNLLLFIYYLSVVVVVGAVDNVENLFKR